MTRLHVVQGDITRVHVDAVVNAANSQLAGGGGVDGAIHRAGGPIIAEQCRRWVASNGTLPTGRAMVTDAGDLPARLVIHTVGPIYSRHDPSTAASLLADCYRNCLGLAAEHGCRTVAFPSISTGVYGYPKRPAAAVAVTTTRSWLDGDVDMGEVMFVCFCDDDAAIYGELLDSS